MNNNLQADSDHTTPGNAGRFFSTPESQRPFIDMGEAEDLTRWVDERLRAGAIDKTDATEKHRTISRFTVLAPGFKCLRHVIEPETIEVDHRHLPPQEQPHNRLLLQLPWLTHQQGIMANKWLFISLTNEAIRFITSYFTQTPSGCFLTLIRRGERYCLQCHNKQLLQIKTLCVLPQKDIDYLLSQILNKSLREAGI